MLYNNKSKQDTCHHAIHLDKDKCSNPHYCYANQSNNEILKDNQQSIPVTNQTQLIWEIDGMDCASCAQKIEKQIKTISEITSVRIIFSTNKLIITTQSPATVISHLVEKKVTALGYKLHSLNEPHASDHASHLTHSHNINKMVVIKLAIFAGLIIFSFVLSWYSPQYSHYTFIVTTLYGLIPILHAAWLQISAKTPFTIETLMSISAMGALFIGATEEATMVIFLFMVGEMLEGFAANQARKGISSLMNLMPEEAIVIVNNQRITVSSRTLKIGDIIEASAGSRLPADSLLLSETALIDQSALTGESIPVEYYKGAKIMAGCLIIDNTIRLKVITESGQNAIDRILQLIEDAESQKAPIERFIDKFSRIYTPLIVLLALLVMLIPPLCMHQPWYDWIYRSLTLLLIGCPCALVISTPATITSALSAAARQGILIKGGATLELLGNIQTIAFDKTGTLTIGKPAVTDVISDDLTAEQLLQKAAAIEIGSMHPLAKAIIEQATNLNITLLEAQSRQAIAGIGIKGELLNETIYLLAPNKLQYIDLNMSTNWQIEIEHLESQGKTVVIVTDSEKIYGIIALQDQIRPEAINTINTLKAMGIKPIMLTGDNHLSAKTIATQLNIDTFYAELLPIDKLHHIEQLNAHSPTAMIGDGINDAPALKAAMVGIAMGEGTDVAFETATVALTHNRLVALPSLLKLAKAANYNIRQNITLALCTKALFLITSILGITGLWIAVLADSGTTALVTANALRLLRFKNK
jgi:Zn2+/Cd2+-exporting ATPase